MKYHDAWKALCQSDGVLVPGGFGLRGVEGKIEAAKWCRMNGKPFLGVCLGLQCAVIEYARYKTIHISIYLYYVVVVVAIVNNKNLRLILVNMEILHTKLYIK